MPTEPQNESVLTVTPSDILRVGTTGWFFKGRQLNKPEIENLKAEAELIQRTSLWKILVNEGKYHAQKRAIIDADTNDDKESLVILRDAQAYHKVVVLFETFLMNITNK